MLAAYLALIFHAGINHAMWRDEAQAWLIARDAASIGELFENLRYDGHPPLWHLLLFPLTRIGDDPNLMLALNFTLMGAAMALALWCLPMHWWERALLPFGVYALYEYGVKARSYGLGSFLAVVFCLAWPHRASRPWLPALVLALLANTHALFFIVSVAAAGAAGIETLLKRPSAIRADRQAAIAVIVLASGWLLAVLTALPPADVAYATGWYFEPSLERLERVLRGLAGGLLGEDRPPWLATLTLMTMAVALWALRRQAGPFGLLAISMGALAFFFYVKLLPAAWHQGVVLFAFLAAAWTSRFEPAARQDRIALSGCVALVLGFQAWFGIHAYRAELSRPYSAARATAAYIAARGWDADLVIGARDNALAPIIAYLGASRFYFLNGDRWGSFTVWDEHRLAAPDIEATMNALDGRDRAMVLLDNAAMLDPAPIARLGFREVGRFEDARRRDETYVLYRRDAID